MPLLASMYSYRVRASVVGTSEPDEPVSHARSRSSIGDAPWRSNSRSLAAERMSTSKATLSPRMQASRNERSSFTACCGVAAPGSRLKMSACDSRSCAASASRRSRMTYSRISLSRSSISASMRSMRACSSAVRSRPAVLSSSAFWASHARRRFSFNFSTWARMSIVVGSFRESVRRALVGRPTGVGCRDVSRQVQVPCGGVRRGEVGRRCSVRPAQGAADACARAVPGPSGHGRRRCRRVAAAGGPQRRPAPGAPRHRSSRHQ